MKHRTEKEQYSPYEAESNLMEFFFMIPKLKVHLKTKTWYMKYIKESAKVSEAL